MNRSTKFFRSENLQMVKKLSGLKPGQHASVSGQYQQIGPRGGKGAERTVVKGKPLPPASTPDSTYKLVGPTKHGKKYCRSNDTATKGQAYKPHSRSLIGRFKLPRPVMLKQRAEPSAERAMRPRWARCETTI